MSRKPNLDYYDSEEQRNWEEEIDKSPLELSEYIDQLLEGKPNKTKKAQANRLIEMYNEIVGFKAYKTVK